MQNQSGEISNKKLVGSENFSSNVCYMVYNSYNLSI